MIEHGDGEQCDSQRWRVTVYLGKEGKISSIRQEVEVGLPEGVPHGSGLHAALEYGLDSEQVKWHNLNGMTMVGFGKTVKITDDGKEHPFPYPKYGN